MPSLTPFYGYAIALPKAIGFPVLANTATATIIASLTEIPPEDELLVTESNCVSLVPSPFIFNSLNDIENFKLLVVFPLV